MQFREDLVARFVEQGTVVDVSDERRIHRVERHRVIGTAFPRRDEPAREHGGIAITRQRELLAFTQIRPVHLDSLTHRRAPLAIDCGRNDKGGKGLRVST